MPEATITDVGVAGALVLAILSLVFNFIKARPPVNGVTRKDLEQYVRRDTCDILHEQNATDVRKAEARVEARLTEVNETLRDFTKAVLNGRRQRDDRS